MGDSGGASGCPTPWGGGLTNTHDPMTDAVPNTVTNLGIIAGSGRFPFMVADGARRAGCRVTVVALHGFADPALCGHADAFHWAGLARPGRWIRLLKKQNVCEVILAGAVKKTAMYGRFRLLRLLPDLTALRIWFHELKDKRNDAVLAAVADELAKHGIVMQDCTQYTRESLAPEGVLTHTKPTPAQLREADFGWKIAKELGRLDIGQTVAVKETEVIAVEAIEGTDRMIERAGQLCPRGGWTLVKVAKPNQDMRFDVPTIGPETIANLARNGAKMLVIEAERTMLVDRDAIVAAAMREGIVIDCRSQT